MRAVRYSTVALQLNVATYASCRIPKVCPRYPMPYIIHAYKHNSTQYETATFPLSTSDDPSRHRRFRYGSRWYETSPAEKPVRRRGGPHSPINIQRFHPNLANIAFYGIINNTCSVRAPMRKLCEVYFPSRGASYPTSSSTRDKSTESSPATISYAYFANKIPSIQTAIESVDELR